MHRSYKIAIADADESALYSLRDLLTQLGQRVVACDTSLARMLSASQCNKFELVVCDISACIACSEGIELVSHFHAPVIITISEDDIELDGLDFVHQVFGVLQKPVRESELAAALVIATQRYDEFVHLDKEAHSLRTALDGRKVIEQAKGILMRKCGVDELSAFRHLQRLARESRRKTVDIASSILVAESVFAPLAHQVDDPAKSISGNQRS